MMFLFLGIFLMGFAIAANGAQAQDGTGPYHDDVIAAGGQGETPNQVQAEEREEIRDEIRERIKEGDYNIDGKTLRIEHREEMKTRLQSNGNFADTDLEIIEEKEGTLTKLKTQLNNGRNTEIKIMPNTASETALARLRIKVCSEENNCSIELKEVGQGEQTKLAYELRAEKRAKIFGLFQARMQVQSQIDAENGEFIRERKPWWSFLASEQDEVIVEENLE